MAVIATPELVQVAVGGLEVVEFESPPAQSDAAGSHVVTVAEHSVRRRLPSRCMLARPGFCTLLWAGLTAVVIYGMVYTVQNTAVHCEWRADTTISGYRVHLETGTERVLYTSIELAPLGCNIVPLGGPTTTPFNLSSTFPIWSCSRDQGCQLEDMSHGPHPDANDIVWCVFLLVLVLLGTLMNVCALVQACYAYSDARASFSRI
jgi:hypothetical protein